MSARIARWFAAGLFVAACAAHADYRIDWHVIAGGGGVSSYGDTRVSGTVAQVATTTSCSSGMPCADATWQLTSGYWTAVPCDATADAVFCDAFDG
jgi:hypothetical protein